MELIFLLILDAVSLKKKLIMITTGHWDKHSDRFASLQNNSLKKKSLSIFPTRVVPTTIIYTCDQIIHDEFVHVCPGWMNLLESVIPFLHRHLLLSLHTRPKIHFWKHGTERFSKHFTMLQPKTSNIIVILCKCKVTILFHISN